MGALIVCMQAFSGDGLKVVERLKLTQEGLEMEYQARAPHPCIPLHTSSL